MSWDAGLIENGTRQGYRIYFKKKGRSVVVLLAGGDKGSQSRDIKTALRLARNL